MHPIFKINIVTRLIIYIGLPLLILISAWAYFTINYQNQKLMKHIIQDTTDLTETIRLGTHYAMTLNSRDDINQIIQNIGKQPNIEKIYIYNKTGQISFSNLQDNQIRKIHIESEACQICHRSDPPLVNLSMAQRTRIFNSPDGHRQLGVITPIYNEKGCSTEECHFHPADTKVLGSLDVVVSLEASDKMIRRAKAATTSLSVIGFMIMSGIIFLFVHRFITTPVQKLVRSTERIANGDFETKVDIRQSGEMQQLAAAINYMGEQIDTNQRELNRQRDEYRTLFDYVPCMISVQDRDYKLLQYNRQFMDNFDPEPGKHCYKVYKGRNKKCDHCPVEKVFSDGMSHYGETSGIGRDGMIHHWIFIASPLKNSEGEVVSAIEMSLDITERKQLEKRLETSEKKYHSIFNNIPNPVFVLDNETLEIIDCNHRIQTVYGFSRNEVTGKSFLDFFIDEEKGIMRRRMKTALIMNQIRQKDKQGKKLWVDIWISPSEYEDKKVLLVATSDITKRLAAEQELIQAGKMATLGEMSTGIAHELNQPLSVIKTASDFILKKVNMKAEIEESILDRLLTKINSNVDRATKIIEHLRNFARKSDVNFENIQINEILKRAHEIFHQQLKVRGIETKWELAQDLPAVTADPGRIEQVFINLLVNARDAIEEKSEETGSKIDDEKIEIETFTSDDHVVVRISDTGIGIPDDVREKIFEPFYTTKEVGKGTGIGLSISYGIIKECKGKIEVYSNPATGGTTFTLRFPFAKENNLYRPV